MGRRFNPGLYHGQNQAIRSKNLVAFLCGIADGIRALTTTIAPSVDDI